MLSPEQRQQATFLMQEVITEKLAHGFSGKRVRNELAGHCVLALYQHGYRFNAVQELHTVRHGLITQALACKKGEKHS